MTQEEVLRLTFEALERKQQMSAIEAIIGLVFFGLFLWLLVGLCRLVWRLGLRPQPVRSPPSDRRDPPPLK